MEKNIIFEKVKDALAFDRLNSAQKVIVGACAVIDISIDISSMIFISRALKTIPINTTGAKIGRFATGCIAAGTIIDKKPSIAAMALKTYVDKNNMEDEYYGRNENTGDNRSERNDDASCAEEFFED